MLSRSQLTMQGIFESCYVAFEVKLVLCFGTMIELFQTSSSTRQETSLPSSRNSSLYPRNKKSTYHKEGSKEDQKHEIDDAESRGVVLDSIEDIRPATKSSTLEHSQ